MTDRDYSPYLFAGDGKTGHLVDLKKPWNQVREAAELTKTADRKAVTMHDVRRTFGLHIARTAGLHMASKLLRHSSIKVTEAHYAPLGIDEMRAVLDKPEVKVIPMRLGEGCLTYSSYMVRCTTVDKLVADFLADIRGTL